MNPATAGVYRPDFELTFEFHPDVETELLGSVGQLVQQLLLHFELGAELGQKTAFSFAVTRQGN